MSLTWPLSWLALAYLCELTRAHPLSGEHGDRALVGRGVPGYASVSPVDAPAPTSTSNTADAPGVSSTSLSVFAEGTISTALIALLCVLGAAFFVAAALLWRCTVLRRRTNQIPTARAIFLPKGLNINFLHIHIDAPPTPVTRPAEFLSPTNARGRRSRHAHGGRGRASRRAAHGPDVGEGGRRLSSGDIDDGISPDDELPSYTGKEGKPPVYERYDMATEDENEDNVAAYELRSRGGPTQSSQDAAVHSVLQ